jgi:hypothetical protein
MKRLKIIIFITGILIAGCAHNLAAQNKAQKTSSAKAYYGTSPSKSKFKKKNKKKVHNFTHTKPAKGTSSDSWRPKRRNMHS